MVLLFFKSFCGAVGRVYEVQYLSVICTYYTWNLATLLTSGLNPNMEKDTDNNLSTDKCSVLHL